MAELRIAGALLPPLWRLVASYAVPIEAAMYAELPFFGITAPTIKNEDLCDAARDPDLAEALRHWGERTRAVRASMHGACDWAAVLRAAATSGNIEILDWAYALGSDKRWYIHTGKIIERAIACDQLAVVDWVRRFHNVPWPKRAMVTAMGRGNLPLVQRIAAESQANTADAKIAFSPDITLSECSDILAAAAEFGDVKAVEWASACAFERGFSVFDALYVAYVGVVRTANREIFEWMSNHLITRTGPYHSMSAMTEATNVTGLKWIVECTKYTWWNNECEVYAQNGYLELIQYARSTGHQWKRRDVSTTIAARNGHLETLIWLVDDGAPFHPPSALAAADVYGHTAVATWIRERYSNATL